MLTDLPKHVTPGPVAGCDHVVTITGKLSDRRCQRPARRWDVAATADGAAFTYIGRQPLTACYCPHHGGDDRAVAQLTAQWDYRAPARVGDSDAVTTAGCMALGSEHAYIVLRAIGAVDQGPPLWRVTIPHDVRDQLRVTHPAALRTLGLWGGVRVCRDAAWATRIGDVLWGAAAVRPAVTAQAPRTRSRDPWLVGLGLGSHLQHLGTFATAAAAIDAATPAWLDGVVTRTAEITRHRGGTLAWGYPVAPLSTPILVEPRPGETSWDAAVRTAATRSTEAKATP